MEIPTKKCPIVSTMNIIGGKWKVPILWYIAESPQRYNQLRNRINGITNAMLTRSLRDLEENGLITRIQFDVIPPHVEYHITDKGLEIIPAIQLIREWGMSHADV